MIPVYLTPKSEYSELDEVSDEALKAAESIPNYHDQDIHIVINKGLKARGVTGVTFPQQFTHDEIEALLVGAAHYLRLKHEILVQIDAQANPKNVEFTERNIQLDL